MHRLDARAKLGAAVIYAFSVALIGDLRALALALVFSAGLILVARLDGRALVRRLLVVNALVAFLWLFLPWSVPGRVLFEWGRLRVTHEGVLFALRVTLRCNAIVGALVPLLATARLVELSHALRSVRVPAKLVAVLLLCIRYVQVIVDERSRLTDAMKVRGFRPGTNRHTYRTYANMLGALLVRSHDRGERVYEAMVCRGFSGRFPTLKEPRLRGVDVVAVAAVVLVTTMLVVLEWTAITH
ncbi:MAG: cobalt ECF transporter T component CbiQ [Verrucomicrobia bacterium]|nr:cobalt ECF transporter T component CbiQ [Verrucomicrobiota bacterium]